MKNSLRDEIHSNTERINKTLKNLGIDVCFDLNMFEFTPMDKGEPNTQKEIDKEASKSDLFILIADNNSCVGSLTFEEYEKAHEQSQRTQYQIPRIKVFVISEKDREAINLKFIKSDNSEQNFETRLKNDSERYLHCISKENFLHFFQGWLERIAILGLNNNLKQEDLSYERHLNRIGQGEVRRSDNKYYRREKLDGEIERILEKSPIVILEGNTYSGKTRAAFELMKNNKEWKNCEFHIYSNANSLDTLNRIRIDLTSDNEGDVFLLDDLNDIIGKNNIVPEYPLWQKFHDFYNIKESAKEDFGNTRIIITVSGKLSNDQKNTLYKKIFHITDLGEDFEPFLKSITVNFDAYDKKSFREMVDEMKRNGEIMGQIVQGNYTIGSLFIKDADLEAKVKELYKNKGENDEPAIPIMLKAIAGHYKYAYNTSFTGNFNEIKRLYKHLKGESFERDIERLRQVGLLVKSSDEETIHIDSFVLRKINEIVINNEVNGNLGLNEFLLEYAKSENAADSNKRNIISISHMGYLICDRNDLSDSEALNLIDQVADKILEDKQYHLRTANATRTANLTEISMIEDNYSYNMSFCETVVARIKNFECARSIIDTCLRYSEKRHKEECVRLYKRMVYAMFSNKNREMTMREEQTMLKYIFNDKSWKSPFHKDDLKNIFNFHRISPFLSLSASDIICYISQLTLDNLDISYIEKKDDEFEDIDEFEEVDIVDSSRYERVFIPRMGEVIITSLCLINSFEEFCYIKEKLEEEMKTSIHIKNAIKRISSKFYKNISNIAQRLTFEDRKKLFDYLLNIKSDTKTIFGDYELDEDYDFRTNRIMALNQLLELLDENDALDSCKKMLISKLHDKRTLSHLFKNKFLNFEQMLSLVENHEKQKNFITLNQLMNRAETKIDALTCIRLMGIENDNVAKLKDERALSQYIDVKGVNRNECIAIIREWHQIHKNSTLSDRALTSMMKKMSLDDLFNILTSDIPNINYMEQYGLHDNEVNSMRKNPVFYNLLFYQANISEKHKEKVKETFDRLRSNKKFLPIIINPEYNANNSILSVYLKNKWLFKCFEDVKNLTDELDKEYCAIWRKDENIYGPILWWIAKNENLDLLNETLLEAYEYFSTYYVGREVKKMMASLYHHIPLCINENIINNTQKVRIAYEGSTYEWNDFKDYLEHVLNENPNYIDGTFIYHTFSKMTKKVNNDVYEILKKIAKRNRRGIKFETLKKLPIPIRQRLFWIDRNKGTKTFDFDFIINMPKSLVSASIK